MSIQYQGFWFPDGYRDSDYACSLKRVKSLQWVLKNWKRKRTVVQAGGSYGVWPCVCSTHFDIVYTFEPEPISFRHLCMNCPSDNVIKLQAALGKSNKPISVKQKSFTGHLVNDLGYTPGLSIDSLKLMSCDAILLDVEGYELYALQGAKYTIEEFRPIVLFEDRLELYPYNGLEPGCVSRFLENQEYKLVADIGADKIYLPKEIKI